MKLTWSDKIPTEKADLVGQIPHEKKLTCADKFPTVKADGSDTIHQEKADLVGHDYITSLTKPNLYTHRILPFIYNHECRGFIFHLGRF